METTTQPTQEAKPQESILSTGTLEMSLPFGAVMTALAKAQAEFLPVEKNRIAVVKSEKANYTFGYADLAAVLGAVLPSLTKYGIAVLQPVTNEGGIVRVQTWLVHGESGQFIRSRPLALPGGAEQKQLGIATTYLRRYQVGALLGLAPEDDVDDGEGETAPRFERRSAPPPQRSAPPKQADRTLEPGEDPPSMSQGDPAAEARAAIAKGDLKTALAIASKLQGPVREAVMNEYRQAKQAANGANGAGKEAHP